MSKEKNKKEREFYFIERFKNLLGEEMLDIVPSECPDFVAQINSKKIGIEHTEIFQDSHSKQGSQLKKRQAIRKKLGDSIVCKLEKTINIPFQLSINFSRHYELGNNEVQKIALEIVKAIIEELDVFLQKHELKIDAMEGVRERFAKDLLKTEPTIEELYAYRKLPKEIDNIHLTHFTKQTFSYYSESDGGIVSDLTDEHLLYTINEKENKMSNYKQCDEYWLLITEGDFYAGSFDELTISSITSSQFNRIYLLRMNKNELIKLF